MILSVDVRCASRELSKSEPDVDHVGLLDLFRAFRTKEVNISLLHFAFDGKDSWKKINID